MNKNQGGEILNLGDTIRKVKKKSKNKINKKPRLKKIIILLFLIITIACICASGLYKIKKIDIKTNGSSVSKEEIQSLSGLNIGMNMFKFNKKEVEEKISQNQYLKSISVKRKLDGTVIINVVERTAKFKINYAGGNILIDSDGCVLQITSENIELPILLGISTDFSSLTVGSSENKVNSLNSEDMKKLEMANSIIDIAKNNNIGNLITKIDISNDKNYVVYLDSEEKIAYLGNCSELNIRILCMKEMIIKESGNKGEIFIDKDLNKSKPRFKETV